MLMIHFNSISIKSHIFNSRILIAKLKNITWLVYLPLKITSQVLFNIKKDIPGNNCDACLLKAGIKKMIT